MAAVPEGGAVATGLDRPGLAELYLRHAPGARRLAFLLTGDAGAAEDLVQDAFVKVAGRLGGIRSPEAFPAYLRRAVVNLATSRLRSLQRERTRLERHARLTGTGGVAEVEPGDDEELWRALRLLPERQRSAVVLRYWLDLSERQIADALGCRPGTVKSLLSRGLAAMREVIDDA